jgi:hypothetical protein
LAAIHDHAAQLGVELIGPHDRDAKKGDMSRAEAKKKTKRKKTVADNVEPGPITSAAVCYAVLKVAVSEYTEIDVTRLRTYLKNIRKELKPPFRFSSDYRSAKWGDKAFVFTLRQAACLSVMHREGDWLGAEDILFRAPKIYPVKSAQVQRELSGLDRTSRLRDLFKGHSAWGTMIVSHPTTRNLFRLVRPFMPYSESLDQ